MKNLFLAAICISNFLGCGSIDSKKNKRDQYESFGTYSATDVVNHGVLGGINNFVAVIQHDVGESLIIGQSLFSSLECRNYRGACSDVMGVEALVVDIDVFGVILIKTLNSDGNVLAYGSIFPVTVDVAPWTSDTAE